MAKFWRTALLFGVASIATATYYARKQLIAAFLHLSPQSYDVHIERRLRVPMPDGITLMADHYMPVSDQAFPTILIRSPYGRDEQSSIFGWGLNFFARRFAERGYHVLIQDVRGRFESEGEFEPFVNERQDGLATVAWLRDQVWFNGELALWGPSYLGMAQWVIAAEAPEVKALIPMLATTQLHVTLYPDDALDVGLAMRWLSLLQALDDFADKSNLRTLELAIQAEMRARRAFLQVPLVHQDEAVSGKPRNFYREWLDNPHETSPIWQEKAPQIDLSQLHGAVHLTSGWYDMFLRGTLRDYEQLRKAGKDVYLTITPHHHFENANGMLTGITEGMRWFDAHLKGKREALRQMPVRVYVMGANEWREMTEFPPREAQDTAFYLQAGGRLGMTVPTSPVTSHYVYDPHDPTPALGGNIFALDAGSRDNRGLEAREDVLTFTTEVLPRDLEIVGYVRVQLYVRSSLEHTDFFGRVCDVYEDGRSMNVCDGLFRIEPNKGAMQADGSLCIEIDLWGTAQTFKAGHRVRLLISSGAHPTWNRNAGTGEGAGTAMQMRIAEQTIYHDEAHPSALILPVTRF